MLSATSFRDLAQGVLLMNKTGRAEISFEDLKNKISERIKQHCMRMHVDDNNFSSEAEKVIEEYIYSRQPYVDGYVKDNKLMSKTLIKDLTDSIVSWGKLTCFIEDDKMRELQINGPVIFVDRTNGYELLRDSRGNVIRFDNPDECFNFIKQRLLFSGERMSTKEPLVNASTIEGYRISCSHPCVNPPHPDTPLDRWALATLRKTGGGAFTRQDFLDRHTAAPFMLDIIVFAYVGLVGMVFAGPTNCGKSTLHDFGIQHVNNNNRNLVIGAPCEFNYRNLDKDGIMINNAIYFEVDPKANPKLPGSATQDHLIDHTLRNSPNMVTITETRTTLDFLGLQRISNMGAPMSTSLHVNDIPGIMDRFANELVAGTGIDFEIAREQACKYLKTATLCERLGDGTRKILGQAEIVGYDRDKKEYIINYLSEFVIVDTVPRDGEEGQAGLVWNVGYFVKRNNLSKNFVRTLVMKGTPKSVLDDYFSIPENTVMEEVNFDKLPEDYIVEYDSNVTPLPNSLRGIRKRKHEDDLGIQV